MWAMLNLVKKMVVVVVKTGTCFRLIGTFEQRKNGCSEQDWKLVFLQVFFGQECYIWDKFLTPNFRLPVMKIANDFWNIS